MGEVMWLTRPETEEDDSCKEEQEEIRSRLLIVEEHVAKLQQDFKDLERKFGE